MLLNSLDLIINSLPLFLKGIVVTVEVFVVSAMISFSLGFLLGALSCNYIKIPILSKVIESITFSSRAIPFFVLLLIVYYVIPDLFHLNLNPFTASVLALGICSSGYVSQFIRGAINAIPISQFDAAFSLGYTKKKTLTSVILPQAFRIALPTMNNELDALLKSTAIISSIGMLDLTKVGMNLVSREMEPVPIYLFIGFLYLCLSSILNLTTKKLENRFSYVKY